ncbi:MAG TPA: NAD(P)(+) transhydrogenase (Re/Si-specific) subunit beta [Actinobacteria bacterium]|nr:NAD(P) transhydrogenase subunit beta [bacterium BMS3Bbin01]HDL48597.1 NAD(P)(+) transhydrogenase (Re/Si-specific) subunit beta [Actinomycetota bacterium]
MSHVLAGYLYLIAAVLFIVGMKRLQSPATARRGNQIGALGMLMAIIVTLVRYEILNPWVIVAGIVVGGGVGLWLAKTVEMTAMPQLVAAFNGFGGGASALVAAAEFIEKSGSPAFDLRAAITVALTILVGGVTLSGSFVAYAKLQGLVPGRPFGYPGQKVGDALLAIVIVALVVWLIVGGSSLVMWILLALSLVLGIVRVIPIGGADMPVVISFLNAFSGIAAALAGFVISENALIISGALVGASGLILTNIMVKAMNRTLGHVLFAAFGGDGGSGPAGAEEKPVHKASAEDVAITLGYANSVIVVPGYGLAVAQAQHNLRELADLLEERGVDVRYAIHPVAGRMPGHMNVLLAEADVPYEKLFSLDEIEDDFPYTDVALIVGANDVVNPSARDDDSSPIYGMPILNVDLAKHAIVIKRSLSPGFAGIDNPLFYMDNTLMFFSDAKKAMSDIITAVKEL